jgi:dienelactone hydrolase
VLLVCQSKMNWGFEVDEPLVRAFFRSVRVPGLLAPNDTAHLKIHYPANLTHSEMERNTGLLPATTGQAPFPIVILLPGINVGPEGLGWLANSLCLRGLVVVTYSLIGEELQGQVSLTPGIDIMSLAPDAYGKRPSALALAPILADLNTCNQSGVLKGLLDLNRVALGGHSAGGTVALLNANPVWFPGVCAAFAYGAHTAAATMLGHPKGSMNAIHDKAPVLIMGGSEDGVIAESAARYGDPTGDAIGRVVATFNQAVTRMQGDCVLAIIKGANHFSIIHPQDETTGRAFLDRPDTSVAGRQTIEALIWAFLSAAFDLPEAVSAAALADSYSDGFTQYARK